MRKLLLALLLVLNAAPLAAQDLINSILIGSGAPVGTCPLKRRYDDITNSNTYWCDNGTWRKVAKASTASGIGTCTSQFVRALNADAAPTCATVLNTDIDLTTLGSVTFGNNAAFTWSFNDDAAASPTLAFSAGGITLTATGTNQNITLTPSGAGYTILNGNVGIGTTGPSYNLEVSVASGNPTVSLTSAQAAYSSVLRMNSAGGGSAFINAVGTSILQLQTGGATALTLDSSQHVGVGKTPTLGLLDVNGNTASVSYSTATNCASSGGTCGSAAAGAISIAAGATTVTVATTAVTAASRIFIQEDSSLGTELSVTCNATISRTYQVTTKTAATSFVITASAAPAVNPACLTYHIIN